MLGVITFTRALLTIAKSISNLLYKKYLSISNAQGGLIRYINKNITSKTECTAKSHPCFSLAKPLASSTSVYIYIVDIYRARTQFGGY